MFSLDGRGERAACAYVIGEAPGERNSWPVATSIGDADMLDFGEVDSGDELAGCAFFAAAAWFAFNEFSRTKLF